MKYTLIDSVSGKPLSTVEQIKSSRPGQEFDWEIELPQNKEGKEIAGDQKLFLENTKILVSEQTVEIRNDTKRLSFSCTPTGKPGEFFVATHLGNLRVTVGRGDSFLAAQGAKAGKGLVKSSMPGKIIKVLCKPGDQVKSETPLLIIEAMKMENEIRSPQSGIIKDIKVSAGQKVEAGESLLELGSPEE